MDDMAEYYQRTGDIRIEDAIRLLGDQRRIVFMGERDEAADQCHPLYELDSACSF
jgi:hypothetical protein